jgi:hypothetical protein
VPELPDYYPPTPAYGTRIVWVKQCTCSGPPHEPNCGQVPADELPGSGFTQTFGPR